MPVNDAVNDFYILFSVDVGSVEGLAYHRGWDTLYWTSYTTSTITRHTVDQSRSGAFDRYTVVTMSGDDHPRAFVLDECQEYERSIYNIFTKYPTKMIIFTCVTRSVCVYI